MQLYKNNAEEIIYRELWRMFGHPGTLLYRGRELGAISEYTAGNPLDYHSRVLDLGCGEGNIGNIIFNKIDVGLDMSFANAPGGAYRNIVSSDAVNMPFKNEAFDLVFSNSVVEHIKDLERLLSEVLRLLSPGGLFIFTVPSDNFTSFLSRGPAGKIYAFLRNKQLHHFNLLSQKDWEAKLSKAGFRARYIKGYLSRREILAWDGMCLAMRIIGTLPFYSGSVKNVFYNRAMELLAQDKPESEYAGLLIIAER